MKHFFQMYLTQRALPAAVVSQEEPCNYNPEARVRLHPTHQLHELRQATSSLRTPGYLLAKSR